MTTITPARNVVARLDRVSRLSTLIQNRLSELGTSSRPLSYRAAAEGSGGLISHEILRQLATDTHSGNISDRTAVGVAQALELPLSAVYLAEEVPRPVSRWKWPERFDRLDESERRQVEGFAAALLASREKGRQEVLDRMRER